ncbi:MAG: FMN-binding protein [Eubacteriales bacterium]|nr:FMN-binding protein [Eubacteriales bacterium]
MRKSKLLRVAVLAVAFLTVLNLSGCGKVSYKDGTYTAHVDANDVPKEEFDEFEESEDNPSGSTVLGEADVTIVIKDGKITSCEYKAKDAKGQPKDENYGRDGAPLSQKKAQKAVAGLKEYCNQLVEKQNINDVDTVTGATISYDEFIEVAKAALKKAKE